MKFPDPPIFTNGKDPRIDHRLLQLRSKMETIADRMPTESFRMVYVQSRVGGDAMNHLALRLCAGAMIQFVTAQEIINYLEGMYGDPNWKQNSRNKYRALRQKDRDFNSSWAEFQRLAADSDHNKPTLIYKSRDSTQRQLATGEELPTSLGEVALRY